MEAGLVRSWVVAIGEDMNVTIPPESTEYLTVAVAAPSDPTTDDVAIGFSADDDTAPEMFYVSQWDDGAGLEILDGKHRKVWYARLLVSTNFDGSQAMLQLEPGNYAAWIKVAHEEEEVVRYAGEVEFK